MPIYEHTEAPAETSHADRLAKESRARITEAADAVFTAYANVHNYLHNNDAGATREQIVKAHGKDAADFESALGAMKRFLVKINPQFKQRLNALTPKKASKVRP